MIAIAHVTRRRAALFAATLLAGSLSLPAMAAEIKVRDAHARDVTVADSSRTLSIGGAITEVLADLGLAQRIAGIDSTSVYPPEAVAGKPNVGYLRQLSSEGVIGLNPTLILAMDSAGPKQTIDAITSAGIPLVSVPEAYSEQGLLDKIALIGHAMGADKAATCLASAVGDDFTTLRKLRAAITKPVRVMFVMSLVNGQAMAAGRNTAADSIIALAGGVNAIDGYDGYKSINDEAIVAARPDVVLTIKRSRESFEADAFYAHPAFSLTPAGQHRAFLAMDGLYLLGFGPRTPAAAVEVASKLYPQLAAEAAGFKPKATTVDCRS
ncbi:heme/hemin ABC transporter substrate-binding protein [Rhodopseudomonas palustris]|uniref:heme/hemin ABC transporter substrate-binding protein n=1 Tax=Rhodopseudomonas palustris TaxID=1076 RepID=UPI000E5BAA13|nr:hemin ABC transporter substrate-binding protein [Rhodopseudomonas palustris]QLH71204.1 hemin ABC transporter substrate-binding protein [Rhodopseudomonas palustris]RIA00955.1 hemin ABC transporter substrate-binding protein [Rhodopseudomonas palustris]